MILITKTEGLWDIPVGRGQNQESVQKGNQIHRARALNPQSLKQGTFRTKGQSKLKNTRITGNLYTVAGSHIGAQRTGSKIGGHTYVNTREQNA